MDDYNNSFTASTMMWRMAAKALMTFIRENIRIIGFDEIEAFDKAKKLYDEAEANDRARLKKRYTNDRQFTPPWIDRDWRHNAV
jgi:hypothetical protein